MTSPCLCVLRVVFAYGCVGSCGLSPLECHMDGSNECAAYVFVRNTKMNGVQGIKANPGNIKMNCLYDGFCQIAWRTDAGG